jgi:hypothetical protein
VIDPLFAVAQRLSGFSEADVEALTKNSEQPTEESELSTDSAPSSAAPSKSSETGSQNVN